MGFSSMLETIRKAGLQGFAPWHKDHEFIPDSTQDFS